MRRVSFQSMIPVIQEAFAHGKTITISVTGQSMLPTLRPRDAVTLEALDHKTIKRGDIVLYRRENGQYVLHRVAAVHGNSFDFCGDAQVCIEKAIPADALLARVCAYERDGVTYHTDEIRKRGKQRLRSRLFRRVKQVILRHILHDEKDSSYTPLAFLWTYLKHHVRALVLMCVLTGVAAVSTLGMALVSGRVIDKAYYNDMHDFSGWFILLFVLLLLSVICQFAYSQLRIRVIAKLKNELRDAVFKELLGKHYQAVQKLHSGDILNRFASDVILVAESAISLIPQTVSLVIRLAGALAFMVLVDPTFTAFIVLGGVIAMVLLHLFSRLYKKLHKDCQESEGKARSFLQECVENLVVIKSFSNEEGMRETLSELQEINYHKQVRRNFYTSLGNMTVYTGFTLAYYLALAWGILRVAGQFGPEALMTLGTFTTFLQLMEQIRTPFRTASGIMPQFYSMIASAERLQELTLLDEEQHEKAALSAQDMYSRMRRLSFKQVRFAYEQKKPVFCDLNMSFCKNTLTAIVGPSGAGKTTLIKLALGLIVPQAGEIVLETDGDPIEIDGSTRALFTYVPQGNMILSGTLADNIRFGNRHVSDERIAEVCRLACLDDTIRALPKGYRTLIGERGIGLSEGQIQRLAIARALASEAPILLLDECTSALDLDTERTLIDNLKALNDRTILFISHRTAVLNNADDIVTIQKA